MEYGATSAVDDLDVYIALHSQQPQLSHCGSAGEHRFLHVQGVVNGAVQCAVCGGSLYSSIDCCEER